MQQSTTSSLRRWRQYLYCQLWLRQVGPQGYTSETHAHLFIHAYIYFISAKCILVTRGCVSVPRRIPTLLPRPWCNLGNDRGCPLVVHYWADLQSVLGFRYYDNMARTRNVSECLYSLYAWLSIVLFWPPFVCLYVSEKSRQWLLMKLATVKQCW